jgi:hypothetical protein
MLSYRLNAIVCRSPTASISETQYDAKVPIPQMRKATGAGSISAFCKNH